MASYNKFEDFVEQLCLAVHNFTSHTFKIFMTEISAGNGYTSGGEDTQQTLAEASGTATVTGTKVVWTATGSVGPFQFVVLYNDDATSPLDAVVAWWDHGSAVTLQNGDTYTVKFNNGDPTGTIFTLT
jgi:hypothetical protein